MPRNQHTFTKNDVEKIDNIKVCLPENCDTNSSVTSWKYYKSVLKAVV